MTSRLPRPHLPSVAGRARTDRWSLLLAGAVVALATLLGTAVPPAAGRTADRAVTDAVRRAGSQADVAVDVPFERDDGPSGDRVRDPRSAAVVQQSADIARYRLGPGLRAALDPPVQRVTSVALRLTDGSVLRTFQLVYLAGGAGPRVTWTAGRAPAATQPPAGPPGAVPWPVEVGLSEQNAAALGLRPGDRVRLQDEARQPKDVRVSGVFSAADPADPAWRLAPQLLRGVPGADGAGTTRLAGLLSPDSLPDARLAVDGQQTTVTITFAPRPDRLTADRAEALAATLVTLRTSAGAYTTFSWRTGLDTVLRDARSRIAAARAQASVLLTALVAVAGLVLLLAADLLVRRRTAVLAGLRRRGASLPGIGFELLLESVAVTAAGGVLGALLGRLLSGGWSWRWAAPALVVAVVAGPVLGALAAARATGGRPAANRSARQIAARTAQLRRVTLEAATVLAAAGALTALHQRGVLPAGPGEDGGNALPAAAPTLAAAVGALALLRVLPPAAAAALRRAARSPRAVPLLGASRAAATAARPLPVLVVVLAVALLGCGLTLAATERAGQADGAWLSVGGDARVDVPEPGSAADVAGRLAAAPGVRAAVAASVTDGVLVRRSAEAGYGRLVVVDPAAFARLLAATPLPGAGRLSRLSGPAAGRVPALAEFPPGTALTVRWDDRPVRLVVVGPAPPVGDGQASVVLVDPAAFAAAGAAVPPDTVWVAGPGAGAAVAALPPGSGDVTLRSDVLAARRSAPLAAGLQRLAVVAAGALLLLGALGVALGAAASAPARAETIARLRTLGLRPRAARGVAALEVVPAAAVAAVLGALLGVALAEATLGPLALRLLTGQSGDPPPVIPWLPIACAATLLVAVAALTVRVEAASHRHDRLGQVLRTGQDPAG